LKVVLALLLVCALGATLLAGRAQAEEGLASWYGPGFEGQTTASGEPYDPYGYTAAHKTLPIGTELVVSYGGASVPVTVNDRGPYVGDREIDLSQGAAQYLGLDQAGVDYVSYEYAGFDSSTNLYQTGAFDPVQYASTEQYAAEDQYGVDSYYGVDSSEGVVLAASAVPEAEAVAAGSATEPVAEPAVAGTGAGVYVAQSGDTLSGVAAQLGTTVEDLAATNGIPDPDLIYAGQTLYY
jgi:rare lipoprotein A